MEDKRVYLIRHGETDYNRMGIVQGSGVNAPLNEKGRLQARAFYQQFRSVPFDRVYTSTLQRTTQSVQDFLAFTPHQKVDALNEISWGVYEGKRVQDHDRMAFKVLLEKWRNGDIHASLENGESPVDVANRQKGFLPTLVRNDHERNVLVCMHGRAMRIFLCLLLGLPISQMEAFGHHNLCLYLLTINKAGKAKLLKSNYTGHIAHL